MPIRLISELLIWDSYLNLESAARPGLKQAAAVLQKTALLELEDAYYISYSYNEYAPQSTPYSGMT